MVEPVIEKIAVKLLGAVNAPEAVIYRVAREIAEENGLLPYTLRSAAREAANTPGDYVAATLK